MSEFNYVPVKKPDSFLKAIIAASFPSYRGRKFRIEVENPEHSINLTSYWDGGSRDYFAAVRLSDMASVPVPQNGTPYDRKDFSQSNIPPGIVIVEHSIFCGKDMGLRFHVRSDDLNPALLPLPEVTA